MRRNAKEQSQFKLNSVRSQHLQLNQSKQADKRSQISSARRDDAHALNTVERREEALKQEFPEEDEEMLIRLAEEQP